MSRWEEEVEDGGFTVLSLNRDRMLVFSDGRLFRWYFTWSRSFNGIFRKRDSFNAIEPIFSIKNGIDAHQIFNIPVLQ